MSAFIFPDTLPMYEGLSFTSKELIRAVRNFLEKELGFSAQHKRFVLAISGGADSLALLCIWQWLRPVYGHTFMVLHVDHCLRSESADEASTVNALCAAWGIPCVLEKVDVAQEAKKHKKGVEDMARTVRYALYTRHAEEFKAHAVCLAHHIRDVQEDILMRLMRGCAWPALGGMVAHDRQRKILRPLLLQEPEALRHLLHEAGLSWAEDSTNADTTYLRNRVRHQFLPLFHAENPAFSCKIAEVWQNAQYDREHWQNTLDTLCAEHHMEPKDGTFTLPAKLLRKIDKATRLRLYHYALQKIQGTDHISQGRAQTFFQLDEALQEGRGNKVFQFSGNSVAKLVKGSICFTIHV